MARYGDLPFEEQIEFFRNKVNLPTERWDDLWQAAHDRAFVVAGAMRADLLVDLRAAVEQAIAEGTTLEAFRRDFAAIVEKRGWSGWTGQGTREGEAWRTQVIYGTNLRTSHAAGRYAQLQAIKHARPYWRYRHGDSVIAPRPHHQALDGLILPADDPFWQTAYPPNGWGCRCYVESLAPRDLEREGLAVGTAPEGWAADQGWNYAPGASVNAEIQRIIEDKRERLPGPIAADFAAEMAEGRRLVFEEQTTAAEAARWLVENDLVDYADYKGVKPEVANAWNRSLFDHVTQFPELRGQQQFAGTAQAQNRRWREMEIERLLALWREANPGVPDDVLRPYVEKAVARRKVESRVYAHSWMQPGVSGVAINESYGKHPERFQEALTRDVNKNWHPPGTASIKAVVDHEFGHQLDALLGLSSDPQVMALWNTGKTHVEEGVSRYGATKVEEMIAEAWAEYRNSPDPRPIAREIGEIIEQRYADRYPN